MDVVYGDFVWNTHKEKANVLKHRVDFKTAAMVFADPDRKILVDGLHNLLEERYFCCGVVDGRVLTVRFTHRDSRIRIFGAGYWRKGKELYEKKKSR